MRPGPIGTPDYPHFTLVPCTPEVDEVRSGDTVTLSWPCSSGGVNITGTLQDEVMTKTGKHKVLVRTVDVRLQEDMRRQLGILGIGLDPVAAILYFNELMRPFCP